MSQVWVRLDEAQRGRLPARCAVSGTRCMTRYRLPVSDLPAATEWWTWTGLWPRTQPAERPIIVVPMLPSRRDWGILLRYVRDVTAVLIPLSLLLMLLTGDGVVGQLVTALALGALILHVLAALAGLGTTVDLQRDTTGRWVRLSGVHRNFVAAVEATTTRPQQQPHLRDVGLAELLGSPMRSSEATGES